jgi:hypothetical protein
VTDHRKDPQDGVFTLEDVVQAKEDQGAYDHEGPERWSPAGCDQEDRSWDDSGQKKEQPAYQENLLTMTRTVRPFPLSRDAEPYGAVHSPFFGAQAPFDLQTFEV